VLYLCLIPALSLLHLPWKNRNKPNHPTLLFSFRQAWNNEPLSFQNGTVTIMMEILSRCVTAAARLTHLACNR
jgi:hypothetical protein